MQTWSQPQSGYAGSRTSPIGIGGAIAVHALAVGIFLLMPKEMIDQLTPTALRTYAVDADPPPPPVEQTAPKQVEQQVVRPKQASDVLTPIVPVNVDSGPAFTRIPVLIDPIPGTGIDVAPKPPLPPVLTEATADYRRGMFQPAYPPTMRRQDQEGKVTVRIRIGTDGRVLSVEKVFATTEAFWEATQEQAMQKWRFRPATSDGTPIESERVMTVYFKLEA